MKRVQEALQPTGIPAFAGAWKSTAEYPVTPEQYLVYTTMITEDEHWDDAARRYRVHVYLNLWIKTDPTEAIVRIRAAMRQAGFAMVEETDQMADDSGYNEDTRQYLTSWTWICETEVE